MSFCSAQKVSHNADAASVAHTGAETNNIVNKKDGGYDHVYDFIPIGTPSAATIAKINSIQPAEEIGDCTCSLSLV